jgi:hypothetical protein
MDIAWKMIASVDANRDYLALLTYLPLKKHRTVPRLLWFTLAIQRQLAAAEGMIGYAIRARPLRKDFWTLSAWQDDRSLTDFTTGIPHAEVMRVLAPHIGQTKFIRWKVPGSALPLNWDEALRRQSQDR